MTIKSQIPRQKLELKNWKALGITFIYNERRFWVELS